MILIELHPRIVENKDWVTLVFIIGILFVVFAKTMFENRFIDFFRLLISSKYTKVYKDSSHIMSSFNVLLFIINLISLSFFIQLIFSQFNLGSKTDEILFIRIITLLAVFILSKYLIEKIIASILGLEELIEQFNLQKINFRTYISLLLLPVTLILYYINYTSNFLLTIIICILLVVNVITYINYVKNFQNLIFNNLFYFILYLCALEIAPYYFIFYLITKN